MSKKKINVSCDIHFYDIVFTSEFLMSHLQQCRMIITKATKPVYEGPNLWISAVETYLLTACSTGCKQKYKLTLYETLFQRACSGVLTILTVDWNFFLPPNNSPSRCMCLGRSLIKIIRNIM